MRTTRIIKLSGENYKKAIETSMAFLKKGETIVVPTDTIYGLACDALNEKAIEKLLKIKERDRQKGLPIFVNSIEMARRLAYIDKKKEEFLRRIWNSDLLRPGLDIKRPGLDDTAVGKITVALYAKDVIPKIATGGRETVALRMPDYKFILDLITALGRPITGTSANISGNKPINSATEAAKQWKSKKNAPALIVDGGEIINNEPSTIVDITGPSPIILRSGIVTKKELDNFFRRAYI
ncbi:MAG: hypothetical protein A3G49_01065 [Candidatus Sungbacteria bacterium RIFCSPLOWO2_12_FULL_41_11]|uniref:L-threonylcarbamoyladenylate synthase n=1 Tax=Candidatus Sungbacteria bacterium RIFCSPLOWO2_12_FULL_41_11 TaxID=1802286 RepID=A0A1G2LPG7_9BACT|nr:MAG: Sua5/YciO/YrdC/YwlC family protein [Parcubacteria group bacterium GW2011_GWA2_42_14]OHA13414.1 MAG: hypothetical protein A3G49_01065 [Candidatus Sungbacteria bacterium RIFCSPLOWO2_12_FULL_41_11]